MPQNLGADSSVGPFGVLDLMQDNQPLEKYRSGQHGLWCKATWGKEFDVRFRNTSTIDLVAYFYVDGQRVDNRVIHPGGTYTVREVLAEVRNIGSLTQEIYKKLQFAEPKMVSDHGGGGGGEERTLDKVTSANASSLGRVHIEIFKAVRTAPLPCGRSMVSSANMKITMGEKAAVKKGGFMTVSTFSSNERVVTKAASAPASTSTWRSSREVIDTLSLRYGSVAQLLLLGVPARHFQVVQTEAEVKVVDLEGEDEEEGGGEGGGMKRKLKKEKKEKVEGGGGEGGRR